MCQNLFSDYNKLKQIHLSLRQGKVCLFCLCGCLVLSDYGTLLETLLSGAMFLAFEPPPGLSPAALVVGFTSRSLKIRFILKCLYLIIFFSQNVGGGGGGALAPPLARPCHMVFSLSKCYELLPLMTALNCVVLTVLQFLFSGGSRQHYLQLEI